jgi:hypothetical protein
MIKVGDKIKLTKNYLTCFIPMSSGQNNLSFFNSVHTIVKIEPSIFGEYCIKCPQTIGLLDGLWRLRLNEFRVVQPVEEKCDCSWAHCRKRANETV